MIVLGKDAWQVPELLKGAFLVIVLTGAICIMLPLHVSAQNDLVPMQQQEPIWEKLNHPYQSQDGIMWDVAFVNASHGWVVGSNGTGWANGVVLHTINGGETWQLKLYNALQLFADICILDSQTLWIAGQDRLFYTTDSGLNWHESQVLAVPGPVSFWTVEFINSTHGWTSSTDKLYKTVNGGQDWQDVTSWTFEDTARMIHFLTETDGWVIGFFGIYRTQDGGNTWEKTHNQGGWALSSVGNGEGWAVGDDMLAYTPNGEMWSEKPLPSHSPFLSGVPYFSGVHFLDADKGWVVGSEPSVMYTPNGGIDWYEQSVSAETRLMSIDFINNTHGWAVGYGGYILRTTQGDSLGPRLWNGLIDQVFLPVVGIVAVMAIGVVFVLIRRKRRTKLVPPDAMNQTNGLDLE